jgi:hypothetical protein
MIRSLLSRFGIGSSAQDPRKCAREGAGGPSESSVHSGVSSPTDTSFSLLLAKTRGSRGRAGAATASAGPSGARTQGGGIAALFLLLRTQHRVASAVAGVVAVITGTLLIAASPAAARFHEYSGSFYGSGTDALQEPHGIAVDNSSGPSSGDVYVTDLATFRVEKFDSAGNFILMFGREVNKTAVDESGTEAEEDLCTATSGDECQAGTPSGDFVNPTFITVDGSSGPSAGDVYLADQEGGTISKFDPSGHLITSWASEGLLSPGGGPIFGITVAPGDDLKVLTGGELGSFAQDGTPQGFNLLPDAANTPSGIAFDNEGNFYTALDRTNSPELAFGLLKKQIPGENGSSSVLSRATSKVTAFTVDQPTNVPYAIQGRTSVLQIAVPCNPTFGLNTETNCAVAESFGAGRLSDASGVAIDSASGNVYVADTGHRRVAIFRGVPFAAPTVTVSVSDIHTESVTLRAQIATTGEDTTYHFEYGTSDCSAEPDPCTATAAVDIGDPQSASVSSQLNGLTPDTTYHYRVLATNALGTTPGPDRTFITYPPEFGADRCPNAIVRQQTGAASLLDCRAYELVSAAAAGGNSVASDLLAGQEPLPGYPAATNPSRVLYTTASGGIPGAGKPTNSGGDPYLATRGADGWHTEYVGIPADVNQQTGPFASTLGEADPGLSAFAFAGSRLCSPCLGGETGLPVRTPSGELVQGMAGSLDPGPGANADILVRKRLSADGEHLVFGSTSQFEPDATPGTPTIYDRDLATDTTHVVSRLPGGGNIPCVSDCAGNDGVAELGLSADGSRVLIGQLISTDAAGNRYWHLYMNVGDSGQTIDLTPGTTTGALYDGMTSDGSEVLFTTKDQLTGTDTDHSADIYRADVSASAATLTRVTTGTPGTGNTDACDPAADSVSAHWNSLEATPNCGALAIAGGGGVASESGAIYFLSPELLDGPADGTPDAPNLYLARPGSAPQYVSTLESALTGPTPPSTHHPFLDDFGSFATTTGVAVQHATGDVYVLDPAANVVKKFDPEGHPFTSFGDTEPSPDGVLSGLKTPAGSFSLNINFFGFAAESEGIAVDQSTGDLYVPDLLHGAVDVFDSSGDYLRQIAVSDPSAVAIDPTDGKLYVTAAPGPFSSKSLEIFDSSGNPAPTFSAIANPSSLAVDSAGTLYVGNSSEVASYEISSGHFLAQVDPHGATGLAVDPADQNLYVDEGSQISRFDPSGDPVGTPSGLGNLGGSAGIAADSGNLFASNGASVAAFGPPALDPSPAIDNPAVLDALSASETPDSAAFEVSPSGNDAVFTSTLPLTGYENASFSEIFRYDSSDESLACASCDPANAPGTGNAALASDGSSLTEDGRVFFTTPQQLVLHDVNGKKDAYEWEQGQVQLISTGTSPFDSGLLSVSNDGTDAYFFTRDTLVSEDENGSQMKIYDARAGGGFLVIPPRQSCAASDECHGAGTEAPPAPAVGTVAGSPHNVVPATKCKPRLVKQHGKCVKKQHHPKKKHQKRADHNRGGKK